LRKVADEFGAPNIHGVLAMNVEIFKKPIVLSIDGTGYYSIRSIRSAVRFMTTHWPDWAKDGKYSKAIHSCCDVIEGYGSAEMAEWAFRRAAAEAGMLSDGNTRLPRQQELHRAA